MKRVIEINKKQGTAVIEFNDEVFNLSVENTGIDHSGRHRASVEIILDLFVNNAVWEEAGMFYNSRKEPLFSV